VNHPGRLQPQCTGEQRFNTDAHDNPQLDPPRGHVDRPASDLPTCPPGSTTTINSDCWVPHETTRGRQHRVERDEQGKPIPGQIGRWLNLIWASPGMDEVLSAGLGSNQRTVVIP
jgi:hypothetical protein